MSWIAKSLGDRGDRELSEWLLFAEIAAGILLAGLIAWIIVRRKESKKRLTYSDIVDPDNTRLKKGSLAGRICLILGTWFTLIYLCWRIVFSVPFDAGVLAVIANLLLLIVEIVGFLESLILSWTSSSQRITNRRNCCAKRSTAAFT